MPTVGIPLRGIRPRDIVRDFLKDMKKDPEQLLKITEKFMRGSEGEEEAAPEVDEIDLPADEDMPDNLGANHNDVQSSKEVPINLTMMWIWEM